MTQSATTLLDQNASAFSRVKALLALLASLIFRPGAAPRIEALFAEAEATLAAQLLDLAIARSGRSDLDRDMYEVKLIWRGALLDFRIRPKVHALHPLHRAYLAARRLRLLTRYRLRLTLQHARPQRISTQFANALRRFQRRTNVNASATTRAPLHTPARITAPP